MRRASVILWLVAWAAVTLPAASRGDDLSLRPAMDPPSLTADALVTRALALLRQDGAPARQDLLRASVLLDAALTQTPRDAELWRWRAELAEHMDDAAAHRASLRRYLPLSPLDDQSQWRLIALTLREHQTLDRRLAAVGPWLDGPQAAGLGAALRSRVASSAAGWAVELGDRATAAARLAEALRLDPANGHAAALALDLGLQRQARTHDLATLLASVVRAAPHDGMARLRLAGALLELRLVAQAQQQRQAAADLGVLLDDQAQAQWDVGVAAAGEPSPQAGAVAALLAGWPASLRQPRPAQQPWTLLDLDVEPSAFWHLEPITATVSLRNGSAVALAVGPDEPLPSRLLIYVTPRLDGQTQGVLPPVVVDLARQLTLPPAQAITLQVRLDRSALAPWLNHRPWQSITLAATAVLDPQVREGGAVGVSLVGAVSGTPTLQRRALLPTQANVEGWQRSVAQPDGDAVQRMQDWSRLWLLAVSPAADEPTRQVQAQVRPWLAQQVRQAPAAVLTWLLLQDGGGVPEGDLAAAWRDRLKQERDGLLWLAAVSHPGWPQWSDADLSATAAGVPDGAVRLYASPGPLPDN